jgi:glycine cleavage system aminomethyltransferase T
MKLLAEGREIGYLTSAAFSPGSKRYIALGYLRHEFAQPGKKVSAEGIPLEVGTLPFPRG